MWITTPWAFLSAVAVRDYQGQVMIRARARNDLEEFKRRLPEDHAAAIIHHTPEADYPYRVTVPRSALAEVLANFVEDELDYPNFKSEVARVGGPARAAPLHDVWETMHAYEDADARPRLATSQQAARALLRPRPRRRPPL